MSWRSSVFKPMRMLSFTKNELLDDMIKTSLQGLSYWSNEFYKNSCLRLFPCKLRTRWLRLFLITKVSSHVNFNIWKFRINCFDLRLEKMMRNLYVVCSWWWLSMMILGYACWMTCCGNRIVLSWVMIYLSDFLSLSFLEHVIALIYKL